MIVSGTCEVLGSDGVTVVRCLQKGDFCGEISSLYGQCCSCTVVCGGAAECRAVFLPIKRINELLEGEGAFTSADT